MCTYDLLPTKNLNIEVGTNLLCSLYTFKTITMELRKFSETFHVFKG